MPTQFIDLDVSATVDITATLNLEDGLNYLLQPQGGAVYIREGVLTGGDLATEAAYVIGPLGAWVVTQGSTPILAWGEGRLVVSQA